MPGFLRGEVPNPNYEREDVNQFSQISEFTNDVYVYGTLYACLLYTSPSPRD